jgi:putative ABC transport system permease protein
MHLLMVPRLAVKALGQNLLRTALTMLGIIIGVGAVICVVAIGEGAAASVERAITNIGANMIWVEAGGVNRGGVRTGAFGTKTLTLDDYHAIKERVSLVTNVTPQADTRVQVVYGNQNWGTSVRGVGPEYVALKNWAVVRGGMYTELDVEQRQQCLRARTDARRSVVRGRGPDRRNDSREGSTLRGRGRAGRQRSIGHGAGSG